MIEEGISDRQRSGCDRVSKNEAGQSRLGSGLWIARLRGQTISMRIAESECGDELLDHAADERLSIVANVLRLRTRGVL